MRTIDRPGTYLLGLLCLATTLSGCAQSVTRGDTATAPTGAAVTQQFFFPSGIVRYPSELAGIQHGVYASSGSDSCCFLSGSSTLIMSKPARARVATLHFYVPDVKPYKGTGLTIALRVDGASHTTLVPIGSHSIVFALPSKFWNATRVPLTILATPSFVPQKIGLNDDNRTLSAILLSIGYV